MLAPLSGTRSLTFRLIIVLVSESEKLKFLLLTCRSGNGGFADFNVLFENCGLNIEEKALNGYWWKLGHKEELWR